MRDAVGKRTKTAWLAKTLRHDIRERSLHEGDQYLTAAEVSRQYDVSPMMAHRAMSILAARKELIRHRSLGTFVGPGPAALTASATKHVHLVGFMDDDPNWTPPLGEMLTGLRAAMPDARLQCHQLPFRDAVAHLRDEVHRMKADDSFGGVILTFGCREVQECVAEMDLPVVVHGSVYPGVSLPYLEFDQKQMGQLMAEHAIQAGCRRVVFVNRENWRHGDTLTFDGILETAERFHLGSSAVRIRNVANRPEAAMDVLVPLVQSLWAEKDGPVGLLCRSEFIAQVADKALGQAEVKNPESFHIIYGGGITTNGWSSPHPCVAGQLSVQQQFEILGRMLAQMVGNAVFRPESVMLPVAVQPA
jgi:DNA-binding LacI/PurR family transcriptional regulator